MAQLRIAMVAGEMSGDRLGAAFIKGIRQLLPETQFEGVGGDLMLAEGLTPLAPMETLSVMGIGAIIKRLPQLLALRRRLVRHWLENPPDVFVGIDAPEFNLQLEATLKHNGIPTIHCVCPSIWAWRPGRIKGIKKAVDHMLVLFPFEQSLLASHGVKSTFVGHPMVQELSLIPERSVLRANWNLEEKNRVLALLPGSRSTEVALLADPFLGAAKTWLEKHPDGQVLVAAANAQRHAELKARLEHHQIPSNLEIVMGKAREVMKASDVALVASGTATLECALLGTPFVSAYRVPWLSYQIFSKMSLLSSYALPNILLESHPVPELLQQAVTPENLTAALMALEETNNRNRIVEEFRKLRDRLAKGNMAAGARAIIQAAEGKVQVDDSRCG